MTLMMNSRLSGLIEKGLNNKRTEDCVPELPPGEILTKGVVGTGKLPLKGDADFYIAGEYDHIARLDDGTYAVIDDKTSSVWSAEKLPPEGPASIYSRQVNAYAYALENPATQDWLDEIHHEDNRGKDRQPNRGGNNSHFNRIPVTTSEKITVSRMGLNSFWFPQADLTESGNFNFPTTRVWSEVEKDYDDLLERCQEIAYYTLSELEPECHKKCSFCNDDLGRYIEFLDEMLAYDD